MNKQYFYPYSASEAKRLGELAMWRESHKANIQCKKAIEEAIRTGFNGMHLNESCAREVIEQYGLKRTNYVLANTLKELSHDGRFSHTNKEWSRMTYIPPDKSHNSEFVVGSHPAVLDGFIDLFRKEQQSLALFGSEHCDKDCLEYEGRVLIMSPDALSEEFWKPEFQLWYAHDGFGCRPSSLGRSIRCTCLSDGETSRWNRNDFIGVIKYEFIPEWAEEQINRLENSQKTSGTQMEQKM